MWITGILDVQFITFQAPVVQKLDSAIHRINLYPVDNSGLSFDEFAFVVTTVTRAANNGQQVAGHDDRPNIF